MERIRGSLRCVLCQMLAADRYVEVVPEPPQGLGPIGGFERIMSEVPQWAVGQLVSADGGWCGRRYRKD